MLANSVIDFNSIREQLEPRFMHRNTLKQFINLDVLTQKIDKVTQRAKESLLADSDLTQVTLDFSNTVREFAAVLVSENIRRSFLATINPENGKSMETAQQKIERAQNIRNLLADWNFTLADQTKRYRLNVHAKTNPGSLGGIYSLAYTDEQHHKKEITKWEDVKAILSNPTLCDISQSISVHRR
jgi:hypothetical protein